MARNPLRQATETHLHRRFREITAQAHEWLIYDGKKASMMSTPSIPEDHPRIARVPEAQWSQEGPESSLLRSTGCYRRYIGTWEIRADRLYLLGIVGRYRLRGNEPLFADWFSGELRLPEGDLVHYVHQDYLSVYEKERILRIENGRVVATETIVNSDRPRL